MRGIFETIVGSRVSTSISHGGLQVPANSLGEYIERFADPAIFNAHELEEYGLSKSGSLTRCRFGDKHFVLTSLHQSRIPGYGFDELILTAECRKTFISSHRAIFPEETCGTESSFDCLAYEFTDLVMAGKLARSNWFELTKFDIDAPTPKPVLVAAVGYPSHRNIIDYDMNTYAIGPNVVWGVETEPLLRDRLSFIPEAPIDFDPNGMSGGPVFAIVESVVGLELRLVGILTNASRTAFNFIPLSRLSALIYEID
ncbi:hypothetical protein [uncultured Sulfitobacter sp.]|uniref:hypothetical protein n=1 Tax=uncultured Sulfitobacter sp. TaxID=191468 RepID=UPI00260DA26D|nr:hypothetical protein [uncultured Sulfitobacter sp.]